PKTPPLSSQPLTSSAVSADSSLAVTEFVNKQSEEKS
ncbi:hypothetical protein A2U01_0087791, partial [Trifolium medium]|nr:hypothetical protein [Trifolium medium]